MKILKNEQIKAISGGGKGVLREDGIDYQLNCPSISQSCLDGYLMCFQIHPDSPSKFDDCIDIVANPCDGLYGVIKFYNCLDAHGL